MEVFIIVKRKGTGHSGGWTLAEVALVIAVVALVAAPLLPNLTSASRQARSHALRATLAELQDAVDRYLAVSSVYPAASQPGPCPDASAIDVGARDADGKSFVPGYLRFAPQTAAQAFGLDPGYGTTLYFGVSSVGKVFATQAPPAPDGHWTDGGTVVYSQEGAPQFSTLAGLCGNGMGGAAGSPLVLKLSTGQQEIAVAAGISVTASVTSGGAGVPGKTVLIQANGSVTGPQTLSCTTDASGSCSVSVTSSTPQYMILSAAVA